MSEFDQFLRNSYDELEKDITSVRSMAQFEGDFVEQAQVFSMKFSFIICPVEPILGGLGKYSFTNSRELPVRTRWGVL